MKYIVLGLLVVLSALKVCAQNSYFVSETGNNSNSGLSATQAWGTVTYACTKANHGDTIFVLPGTYKNASYGKWEIYKIDQTIKINNVNSSTGKYLVIKPYNKSSVKIKGDGDYIIQIRNSSYIQFEGFEIEGEVNNIPLDTALKYQFVYRQCLNSNCTLFKDTFRVPAYTPAATVETLTFQKLSNIINPTTINNIGLLVQGSNHINILNNEIHHNTGTGIRFFECDYIVCERNNIHNNSRRSSVGNHGLVFHSSKSIDASNNYKIAIQNNWVHHNYNEVYSWSPLKTFITPHIDEGKGISMQKNSITNGWVSGKMLIQNNICDHNGFSGIHINEGIRMDIVNNTCFMNSLSFKGDGNNIGISTQDADSIGIFNNISVAHPLGYAISAGNSTHLNVSDNFVQGAIDSDIDGIDINTTISNANFADTVQFNLLASSTAINKANILYAPRIDYFYKNRDNKPDCGAVEFLVNSTNTRFINMYQSENKLILPNNFLGSYVRLYSNSGSMISSQKLLINEINITSFINGFYTLTITTTDNKIYYGAFLKY